MIKELFIPYTESLELKKLGFEEECFGYYNHYPPKNNHPRGLVRSQNFQDHNGENEGDDLICSAILYQQAFDFFRKKYNWHVTIKIDDKSYYFYDCISNKIGRHDRTIQQKHVETYEEAKLECLRKLIKICQEQ